MGARFILSGAGATITVTGVFDTYYEGQYQYVQLIRAEME